MSLAFAQLRALRRRISIEQLVCDNPRCQFRAAGTQPARQRRLVIQLRRHRAQYSVRHCVGRDVDLFRLRVGSHLLDFVARYGEAPLASAPARLLPASAVSAPVTAASFVGFTALLLPLASRQRRRVFLRLQPGDIALRADDVHRLAAISPINCACLSRFCSSC